MRMTWFKVVPLVVAAVFFTSVTFASADTGEERSPKPHSGYDGEVEKGWYWYEVVKEKPEMDTEKPNLTETVPPDVNPWDLSAEEFRDLFDKVKDTAVTSPTVQNVSRYIEWQDVARRKAVAFANVFQLVMQNNPEFSISSQYPTTTPGMNALVSIKSEERENLIRDATGEFALIYFHRPDCKFCKAQNGILRFFVDKYGWPIKKVNIYTEPEAASRFNVSRVPYILIVSKETGDYMPLSSGVISFTEIEQKLYNTIRYMRGDVTPSRFSLYEYQDGGPGDPDNRDEKAVLREFRRSNK